MPDSRKVWDSCFSCSRSLDISTKQNDWRECARCACFLRVMMVLFGLSIVILWIFLWLQGEYKSPSKIISVSGLSLDILGAWLLATGYVEILVQMASGWGGGEAKAKRLFSEKNFKKRMGGLVCLAVGFLCQGIGAILS